ncbi:MAG: chorismate mutase [Microcystaceae cyanobacterium]
MAWRVRAIRGAITANANTKEAIEQAVINLLNAIEAANSFVPDDIVNVIFTATSDLNAVFPAAIARQYKNWHYVPLLDVQQLEVEGSLKRCIRVLIQINTEKSQQEIRHCYLEGAEHLRLDLSSMI